VYGRIKKVLGTCHQPALNERRALPRAPLDRRRTVAKRYQTR